MRTKAAPVVELAAWRPEWQRKEERQQKSERYARIEEILESPVPPEGELRDEALRVLRSIMLDVEAADNARVGAAARVVEATKPKAAAAPAGLGTPPPGGDPRPWMTIVDDEPKQ